MQVATDEHSNTAFQQAWQQWRSALAEDRFVPEAELSRYRNNCLNIPRRILAALQPCSEDEVVRIVRIAATHRVALYTISTGHNWGYGSAIPVTDDCVLLDLSRMNRIVDFDTELGLVTLEPGVTQQQLADYLQEHGLEFYVPTTGAGPTASIVGNALERGFGITPVEDHFQAVTSLRAVLADGSVYRSPFAEQGAPYAGVWKWQIGPYMDGLFAQANMGIITAMQVALAKRPEHTEAFAFALKKTEGSEPMLVACKTLLHHMRGHVGGLKLLNRAQVVATAGTEQLGMGIPEHFEWMGIGVFRCPKGMTTSIRREIRKVLGRHASRLVFVNDRRNTCLQGMFKWVPGKAGRMLCSQLERFQRVMDIMNGIPRSLELKLAYQFVPMPKDREPDPAGDNVGILWYAPVLPMKPKLQAEMLDMISEVLEKHGFPDTISLTTVDEKCAIGVIPIIYNKAQGAEKAHACYHELWERGDALGCPPYRINTEAMFWLTDRSDSVYWDHVNKIKAVFDPSHILSPGRYAPVNR